MTVREQWAWVGAILLVLIGGLFAATRALQDELFPITLGSKAPRFEATTVDAKELRRTLDDYRGKVVLLNIWATWCTPCIVEMPTMEALHREFKNTDLPREYQATGYPETFVIGRDGIIRKKVIGAADWNSEGNRALVRQLLAERGA
jgi:cytochrome c biogenesis protein CcmG/thiol:disulfide interchange protein DsbE